MSNTRNNQDIENKASLDKEAETFVKFDDEQTENLFFKSESIEAGKWTEKLNSILFDKIQVTVCVAFEDGTNKTQTIAIAAAASDANSTYEKGQTQKEKLIQYEMR